QDEAGRSSTASRTAPPPRTDDAFGRAKRRGPPWSPQRGPPLALASGSRDPAPRRAASAGGGSFRASAGLTSPKTCKIRSSSGTFVNLAKRALAGSRCRCAGVVEHDPAEGTLPHHQVEDPLRSPIVGEALGHDLRVGAERPGDVRGDRLQL